MFENIMMTAPKIPKIRYRMPCTTKRGIVFTTNAIMPGKIPPMFPIRVDRFPKSTMFGSTRTVWFTMLSSPVRGLHSAYRHMFENIMMTAPKIPRIRYRMPCTMNSGMVCTTRLMMPGKMLATLLMRVDRLAKSITFGSTTTVVMFLVPPFESLWAAHEQPAGLLLFRVAHEQPHDILAL
jgi:hypothetical protein